MQKADSPQGKWPNLIFFFSALLVVAADQSSKIWIRSYPESQTIFEAGFFRIIRTHNTGAVFGLFQGQSFPLAIIAIVAIVALLFFTLFIYHRFPLLDSRLGRPALGLVLGGTMGNLVDRLRFVFDSTAGNLVERLNLGYVTDFIDIGIWPTFNIADPAITVGVILFAYSLLPLTRAKNTDLSA